MANATAFAQQAPGGLKRQSQHRREVSGLPMICEPIEKKQTPLVQSLYQLQRRKKIPGLAVGLLSPETQKSASSHKILKDMSKRANKIV